MSKNSLLGIGIYSIAEASRLTKVERSKIRRWALGYRRIRQGAPRYHSSLWEHQIPPIDNAISINFLELMEVRFVSHFREAGVSWNIIRKAAENAMDLYKNPHPFSTKQFRSEGRKIFADIIKKSGERALIDLATNQMQLREIVDPALYVDLDFSDDGMVLRWWPMGKKHMVVIDPERSFGQPIIDTEGVPTSILASAYKAEKSYQRVAKWYGVGLRSVKQSVQYEERLAA